MKTARVIKSGNSQAIRLPREFQIDAGEVQIFRQKGDLVLRPLRKSWQDYFARGRRFCDDFPPTIDDQSPSEDHPW